MQTATESYRRTRPLTSDRELVVTRHSESLNWLAQVDPQVQVTVFNRGTPLPMDAVDVPNVGRDGRTLVGFICDNYDDLADVTFFAQGNPFDHSPDFVPRLKHKYDQPTSLAEQYNDAFPPTSEGYVVREETVHGHQVRYADALRMLGRDADETAEALATVWQNVFVCPQPQRVEYGYGLLWAVPRAAILARPREFWCSLYDCCDTDESAYSLELIVGYLLRSPEEYPTVERVESLADVTYLSALTYDCFTPEIHVVGDLSCTGESTPSSITIRWSDAYVLDCEDQRIPITGTPQINSSGTWVDATGTWINFGDPNTFRIEGLPMPSTLYQIRVVFTWATAPNSGTSDGTTCFTSAPNIYTYSMFGGLVGDGSASAGLAYSHTTTGGVVGSGEAWAQHGQPVGFGSLLAGTAADLSVTLTPAVAGAGARLGGAALVPRYYNETMSGGVVVADYLRLWVREIEVPAGKVAESLDKYLLSVACLIPATKIGDPEAIYFTSLAGARLPHELRSYDSETGALIAVVKTRLLADSDNAVLLYYGATE